MERNSAWVGSVRDKVDFSPKDTAQVAAFLSTQREARQVRPLPKSRSVGFQPTHEPEH